VRHGHAVDLHQDVVGEPGLEIQVQNPAQPIVGGRRLGVVFEAGAEWLAGLVLLPDEAPRGRFRDAGQRVDIGIQPVPPEIFEERAGA